MSQPSIPKSKGSELVWNPITSRAIKKNGRVHKRLQRDHPELLEHASQVDISMFSTPPPRMRRYTSEHSSHTFPSLTRDVNPDHTTVPETTQGKGQEEATQDAVSNTKSLFDTWLDVNQNSQVHEGKSQGDASRPGYPFEPMLDDPHNENNRIDHTVNTWLDKHGPDMLADYKNPDTDFLDSVFRKLHLD